jgi:hypothetical protein
MRHSTPVALVLVSAWTAAALPSSAVAQDRLNAPARGRLQAPVAPAPQAPVYQQPQQSAGQTQNELQRLLNELPPNVRSVLQLDPSLLDQPDYLAPYPALVALLQQHPEVSRNPRFFLGEPPFRRERDPKAAAYDAIERTLAGAGLFTGIIVTLIVIASVLRQLIDYRRWLRQSKVQTEANTKVLDRMSTNEDLLAYLQTPAGASFLQAAPISVEAPRGPVSVPVGRILWSVQAGVVLAALGIGLWLVKGSVMEELAPGFIVLGTVAVAVGVGFVLSAAIAWVLTSRVDAFTSRA